MAEVPKNTRQATRRQTNAPSTMRAHGAPPIHVIVINVSATGMRIKADVDLSVGTEISIGVTGFGATRAFVVWKDETSYGCSFERPLSAEAEANAFTSSQPVILGRRVSSEAPIPAEPTLQDLHARHRPWKLPLDAIFMIVVFAALVTAFVW